MNGGYVTTVEEGKGKGQGQGGECRESGSAIIGLVEPGSDDTGWRIKLWEKEDGEGPLPDGQLAAWD